MALGKLKRLASIGARETKASRFYWRSGNSASRFYWRSGNSASHSPWIVRRDTKVKIIIWRMFKFIFPIKAERK
ncbi:hypothetical protein [Leptospira noguchii]|uniref:hypothetical protein n=1 Tax=Leptospira noguchii TaxID=28182 RepID=UPI001FB5E2D6|nr:hypothetical protein [Leptospira noguchii]UOG53170.1 hypothetical protein MAL09_02940 [Leptospira noguchii]